METVKIQCSVHFYRRPWFKLYIPIKRTCPWESEAQIVVPSLDHLASKTGPWPWTWPVLPCSSIIFRCLKSMHSFSVSQTIIWPSWAAVSNKFIETGWGSTTKMSFSCPVKVFKSLPLWESQILSDQSDTAVMTTESSRDLKIGIEKKNWKKSKIWSW